MNAWERGGNQLPSTVKAWFGRNENHENISMNIYESSRIIYESSRLPMGNHLWISMNHLEQPNATDNYPKQKVLESNTEELSRNCCANTCWARRISHTCWAGLFVKQSQNSQPSNNMVWGLHLQSCSRSGLWSVAGEERFLSTSLILFQDLTCLAMSVEGNGEQAKSSAGESIAVTSPYLTCSEIATSLYIYNYTSSRMFVVFKCCQ